MILGKFFLILSLMFVIMFPSLTNAARFSGEYLLHMCGVDEDGKELVEGGRLACQAYIAGVLDYHNFIQSMDTSPNVKFCVPENISMNELQLHVYSYLYKNRREHSKFVASPGVALALFLSFPCNE